MSQDTLQLPSTKELKEFLKAAKQDINTVGNEEAELAPQCELISEVIQIMEEQVGNKKDLNKLTSKEKIFFAAHLSFLQSLLEDIFLAEEFEDFDELEDLDEAEDWDETAEVEEEEEKPQLPTKKSTKKKK
jgi:hypothetical protein